MAYQFLRGDTLQNDAYTGPSGSITVDLEGETVRVHDGVTPGGAYALSAPGISQSGTGTSLTLTLAGGASVTLTPATTSLAGLMGASDKTKLDSVSSGAQANTVTSVSGKTGAVSLTASDVGLGSVVNVSFASQSQAESASSTSLYMSPLRTAQTVAEKTGIVDEGGYTRKKQDEVYWFYGYRSSNYSTPASTSAIVFNASRSGSRGYSTGTGVFTAPAAGVYSFNAQVLRQGGVNANGIHIGLSKNSAQTGSSVVKSFSEKSGTTQDNGLIMANVSAVFELDAGDTVRVLAFNAIPVAGSTSDIYTFFQGHLL